MNGEPWVPIPNHVDLKNWTKEDEIRYNQENRQGQKLAFYRDTFDFLSENRIVGDYYEFGCHQVRTFRMALTEARRHMLGTMQFYAFDSFRGLPETKQAAEIETWNPGALRTTEREFLDVIAAHGIYPRNVHTVSGFYEQSLSLDRQMNLMRTGRKIALACVDCDLYESAVLALSFIENLIQPGTVIYMDDWYAGYRGSPVRGVAAAFSEFMSYSQWKFQPHVTVGWWGRSFIAYE